VNCICASRTLPINRLSLKRYRKSGPVGLRCLSVAHYGEQNGDLMRDPEMCFELSNFGRATPRSPSTGETITSASSNGLPLDTRRPTTFRPFVCQQHERFAKVSGTTTCVCRASPKRSSATAPNAPNPSRPERMESASAPQHRTLQPLKESSHEPATPQPSTATFPSTSLPSPPPTPAASSRMQPFESLPRASASRECFRPCSSVPSPSRASRSSPEPGATAPRSLPSPQPFPFASSTSRMPRRWRRSSIENLQRRDVHPIGGGAGIPCASQLGGAEVQRRADRGQDRKGPGLRGPAHSAHGASRVRSRGVLCRGDRRRTRPLACRSSSQTSRRSSLRMLPRGVGGCRKEGQAYLASCPASPALD
jgi:hypothetical protein